MVVSTVPAGLAEGSFVAVFGHVLYDTAFFCYPLPQFAGVNLALFCWCLEKMLGALGVQVTVPKSRN
jgi:hypothetical protein